MSNKSIPGLLGITLGLSLAPAPLYGQLPGGPLHQQRKEQKQQQREMKREFLAPAPDTGRPDPGLRGPGPHNGDWLRRYKNLPPEQQQRLLQNDANFRRLPADRQQKLIERLQWFNRQSPEQQQRILQRMETWEHLTPEQRQQATQLRDRIHQFPEERRRVHQAIGRLSRMDPDERKRALSSEEFRSNFSDQEREVIGSALTLGVPPGRMNDGPGDDGPAHPRRPHEDEPEY